MPDLYGLDHSLNVNLELQLLYCYTVVAMAVPWNLPQPVQAQHFVYARYNDNVATHSILKVYHYRIPPC